MTDTINDWLKLNHIGEKYDDTFIERLFEALGDESKVIKVLAILETSCSLCFVDERDGQCYCGPQYDE